MYNINMDYTIKQGDTLANIAKQYNTTPEQLGVENKIADINKIVTGQNIKIPTVTPTAPISAITTPAPINVPTPAVPATISTAPIDATRMSAEQYLAQFQQAPSVAQAQQQTLMGRLSDIMGIQSGKGTEQIALEQQAGLEQQRKNIQDLTSQLNAITTANEAQKLQVGQLGGRGLPSTGRRTAELDRETAIRALPISAQINAAQGNLALAESNIQNYITTKYADIDSQIANVKYFIEQNRADMTAEEKKRADQQAIRLADYERQVNAKKAQDEAIQKIAATAGSFDAPAAIIMRISQSPDVNTAIANATGYLRDPQEKALKQAQYAKIYADIKKTNAEADKLKEVPVSGELITPSGKVYTKEQATAGEQAGQIAGILSKIKSEVISESSGFKSAVGASGQKLIPAVLRGDEESQFISGTAARDFDSKVSQLKNALALPNLSQLKGATSDKDIIFLKNIATSLSVGTSEDEFKNEIKNVESSLKRIEDKYGIKISDFMSDATQGTQGGEEYTANGVTYVKGADGLYYPKQ